MEQDGLVFRGAADTPFANHWPSTSWQQHVYQFDSRQLVKHSSRFIAQAGPTATLAQCLPKHIGKETNEDVSLDSLLFLMPNRADLQVRFVNFECCLCLR